MKMFICSAIEPFTSMSANATDNWIPEFFSRDCVAKVTTIDVLDWISAKSLFAICANFDTQLPIIIEKLIMSLG